MMVRQKTGGSAQRQESDTDNTGPNPNNSCSMNMNPYGIIPPVSNNYNTDPRNGNNYPMVQSGSRPPKRKIDGFKRLANKKRNMKL